tara:strand:+ start:24515 stop:24655 length:141 start_codon:yes stop_codon:yes gene_type:complete
MPNVKKKGKPAKKFPYTKAGKAAATKYAKSSGGKMSSGKSYDKRKK